MQLSRLKQLICTMTIVFTAVAAQSYECGIPQIKEKYLIVNGLDSKAEQWPWHVAIFHQLSKDVAPGYACGGSLIHKKFILTAKHCILDEDTKYHMNMNRLKIQLGVQTIYNLGPQVQEHKVLKIHSIEDPSLIGLKNDIALLELRSEAMINDYVLPVCLPASDVTENEVGTVVGFGLTENDTLSSVLKEARMPVVPMGKCLRTDRSGWGGTLDEGLFCAGQLSGSTVCNGDSGGGLVFQRGNSWELGGIVSFTLEREFGGSLCEHYAFGAFTRVFKYISWIRNITQIQESKIKKETDSNVFPADCGRYLVNKIYHGSKAQLMEFPWMVLLAWQIKRTRKRNVFCHGTLISQQYVLTSGECVKYKPQFQVILGEYDHRQDPDCYVNDTSQCAPPVQYQDVKSITVHHRYNISSKQNNIALIRLKNNVLFNDNIQPICLPVSETLKKRNFKEYIISGWGSTSIEESWSDVLLKATLPAVSHYKCQKESSPDLYVGPGVICAGNTHSANMCDGDEGGPLGYPVKWNNQIRFVQYGVQSVYWCGGGPSIHTDLEFYLEWILDVMGHENV